MNFFSPPVIVAAFSNGVHQRRHVHASASLVLLQQLREEKKKRNVSVCWLQEPERGK